MVDTLSIVDQADAIPVLFREVIDAYSDIASDDEQTYDMILRHILNHICEAHSMLKTLGLFVRNRNDDTRKNMRAVSDDLSETMNALAKYVIMNEFIHDSENDR